MSETVLLVGATGLIGRAVLAQADRFPQLRIVALARRSMALPRGRKLELRVADTAEWPAVIGKIQPKAVICALGTTWKAAGKDEHRFRAVDEALVLSVADAAHAAGATQFVQISSVGASAASKRFYLAVKGKVEDALAKIGFDRFDILQPSLLLGARNERRLGEQLAQLFAPLAAMGLHGANRRFRPITDVKVARAALSLVGASERGIYRHTFDELKVLAPKMGKPAG